jgi:hypothetical protein
MEARMGPPSHHIGADVDRRKLPPRNGRIFLIGKGAVPGLLPLLPVSTAGRHCNFRLSRVS